MWKMQAAFNEMKRNMENYKWEQVIHCGQDGDRTEYL